MSLTDFLAARLAPIQSVLYKALRLTLVNANHLLLNIPIAFRKSLESSAWLGGLHNMSPACLSLIFCHTLTALHASVWTDPHHAAYSMTLNIWVPLSGILGPFACSALTSQN